jgi:ABC-type dipeptide/oligopeptide/nickel transport system permease subunit
MNFLKIDKKSSLIFFLRRLKRNKLAFFGGIIILFIIIISIIGPFLAPYGFEKQNLSKARCPPSKEFPLGNDEFGRCILSRILFGARISLMIGVISIGIGLVIGVTLGLISGYYGKIIDNLIMRAMDVMLAFPYFVLAIAIIVILGPGFFNIMLTIGIYNIPTFVRVVRSIVLSQKEKEYIEAARAFGENNFNIIFRYLLPNCISSIIVYATLRIGTAILVASILGFLGLGIMPPTPEWGAMVSSGTIYLRSSPHIMIFPGLAIMITVLSFNLLGDGLRDALDPRLKELTSK